ncbi:MAG: AtpZ/AtpI family protein [Actinobacteria bacterium]|nr:AtpZ/AtpI family protein [Actinomycetota bacterium]
MPSLSTWQALGIVTQFGVTCAVAVGLGYLLGNWLDNLLGTGLLFTLIGALGGMISAITGTLRLMKYVQRRAGPAGRGTQE